MNCFQKFIANVMGVNPIIEGLSKQVVRMESNIRGYENAIKELQLSIEYKSGLARQYKEELDEANRQLKLEIQKRESLEKALEDMRKNLQDLKKVKVEQDEEPTALANSGLREKQEADADEEASQRRIERNRRRNERRREKRRLEKEKKMAEQAL